MGSRRRFLAVVGVAALLGTMILASTGLPAWIASASPLRQFPTSSVTVVSDPPPPDLPGQFSERTRLQDNPLAPGGSPGWRLPVFDDSGWSDSYPAVALAGWGAPAGSPALGADFIWGGQPGGAVGGRFEIPSTPDPQFLFVRKNFCIPINGDVNSVQASTMLQIQGAATPGDAAITYNGFDVGSLPGREDGTVYGVDLSAALAASRRLGRNTLAMSVYDEVDDTNAAVAYHMELGYSIDESAITVNANPPSGVAVAGDAVAFSQSNTGLSGDGPYSFSWDLDGDGAPDAGDGNPTFIYPAAGTYTVTLTMADRFGCPSAPVSLQYAVATPAATETPTNTPTPTDMPLPTETPVPAPTNTPRPRQSGGQPSAPQPTVTLVIPPTFTPTAIVPILLPLTGDSDPLLGAGLGLFLVVGVLLVTGALLRRPAARRH